MPSPSSSRIILVVAAYYPDSYGGAERQAAILAEALGRKGIDVTMLTPTVSADASRKEAKSFGRLIRKRVRAYPNLGGRNFLSFLAWSLWVPWLLRGKQWRGVPIYVFHARLHALGPALAALLQGSKLLIKLGGGGEASEFDALRTKKYLYGHFVEHLLRRRVNAFVANSGQIAQELRSLGIPEARIAEFPNGVSLPPMSVLEEAIATRSGRRFIYAARLIPDKNVDVLYRAAMHLAEEGQSLELRLVGDGSERDRLEGLARMSAHGATVTFPGFASDIYPEMIAADFFVCASAREGQSNALLEAMSAGLIPIVYNASGVAEVVTHGENGFIVQEATAEAFTHAMRTALALCGAERKALSLQARAFVENNIGIDAIADRTLATIKGLDSL